MPSIVCASSSVDYKEDKDYVIHEGKLKLKYFDSFKCLRNKCWSFKAFGACGGIKSGF